MDPAPHIYAVNPYPPHQGIIMPSYMQQQHHQHHPYHNYCYYQPPRSEETMHHQQIQVPTSCSSGALPYGVNYPTSCYPLYHAPPTPFCCNHIPHTSYSPSVVLQPPQPQPLQLWGAQPVHHILPPSYAVAETPTIYKNSTVNHCCGCPNHVCTPKDASPVIKIEEKEQSPRGGGAEDQSMRLADYPYPFHVWRVPALDNEKNKNNLQPLEQLDSHDRSSYPSPRNLLPFQVGDLARLGDGRNSQNQQQQGEDRKQFPFPFVLVPYPSSKQEGGAENIQSKDGSLRSSQDHSVLGTKNDSYNSEEGNYGKTRESRLGGDSEADVKEVLRPKEISSSSKKDIPVKEVLEPPHGHHRPHDDDEKRMKHAAPENSITEDGSCSRVDAKKQPEEKEASQVKKNKSSKLPPVCLRLEPLRKKKTSGDKEGSRSLSSPTASATKNRTTSVEGTHSVTSSDNNNKHHPVEKKVRMIEVKDDSGKDGEDVMGTSTTMQIVEEENAQKNIQLNAAADGGHETAEDSAASASSSEEEKKTEQPELQKRKMLSETEAATYIQAAYRGFEVRKSETLEKLKQLGKIHDEVTKMKKSVEDLKFSWSSEAAVDQVKLTKQKMVIGESIMGLLLRIDTIQGLHPSLRDIRKSLAKELVTLQEQLDSIASSRSCCDEANLMKEKNKEHGDMYYADKEEESPIPEVMHQETLSEGVAAEEDSLPLEAIVQQQQQQTVECSEMVSAGEERADVIIQPPEEEDGTADAMKEMEQKSTTRPAGEVEAAEEEKSEEEHQKMTDGDEDNNAAVGGGDESCNLGGADNLPVTELPPGVVSEVPISNTVEEPAETGGSISCEPAPSPDHDEEVCAEDGKKKGLDENEERLNDDDGLLQKDVQEEVEHTMSIVTHEEEVVVTEGLGEEQHPGSSSSSNVVAAAPEEEEECVVDHRDDDDVGVGEQVVEVDDNGDECKVALMSCDHEREMNKEKERVVVLEEEKEKMEEMMQKLMDAGKEQMDVILSLTSRVKDLERKLALTSKRKKRTKQKKAVLRQRPSIVPSAQSN